MKKIRSTFYAGKWRTVPVAMTLSAVCALSAFPVQAQEPTQNSASLNFVGADIESVVKAIGHYTGITFIIDPRVKGQLTLVSEKPLTKDQAFKLLSSTLRLQGYTVVTGDGYSKVVPEADAKLQASPTQAEGVKGDQIATEIFRLNYESAANMQTVLRPLISPNNTISVNPGNNSVVITDYADNLKRMAKIIASLDNPANSDVDVIPVKYAIASDLASMISKLTSANGANDPEAGRTTVLVDSRTNSILLKAASVARANLVKTLIAKLDQPTNLPGNVHVVYLKNAEAVKLAVTLRAIVSSDTSTQNSSASSNNFGNAGNASAFNNNAQQGANGSSPGLNANQNSTLGSSASFASNNNSSSQQLSSGGAAGFIQADAATNTLIITASEPVYRNLRAVIDQLDARRAQVYVESLIVEMSVDKSNEFGIQWLALTGNQNSAYRVAGGTAFGTAGNNILNLAAGNSTTAGSVLPGNGFNLGIFRQVGGQLGLGALAHALESDGGTNVLSIPTLVTLDNEAAKIVVGQNVPFITGQFTSTGTATGTVNPFQTIDRKDVGISLQIKPQISEGGTIKLQIAQEVSSIDPTVTSTAGIVTKKRTIETSVLVDDGQIIALGGLIDDAKTDSVEKVSGLGDIPVIGNLFKYRTNTRNKTNLMVFIRPRVIRTAEQSEQVSVDRYDYMHTQVNDVNNAVSKADRADLGDITLPELDKSKWLTVPGTTAPSLQMSNGLTQPAPGADKK
jgi:general secretion pathway protein D